MKDQFINSIHSKKKIRLTFYSKEDGKPLVRLTAPMDYGPSRRSINKDDRYHFWDYESDTRNHVLSLLPSQIIHMEDSIEPFEPSEFVTWETDWFISRDWGNYS
jgi:hypothetical protein